MSPTTESPATVADDATPRLGDGTPQRAGGLHQVHIAGRVGAAVGPATHLAARRDALLERRWTAFSARLLGTTIGAEIDGLDLRRDLDDETLGELVTALHAFKVLVLRDQHLDADQQLAFARRLGPLDQHPFLGSDPSTPDLVRLAKDAAVGGYENIWHSDVTWQERPPMAAVLRAVEVPPVGGDTLWADMAAAYEGLDADTRAAIDGREAVHDFTMSFGAALAGSELEEARRRYPPVRHPVVRTHPDTGERVLFVNRIFTRSIVGLPPDESEALLDVLFRQADVPEHQVRLRWTPGTMAIWDNRSTQHYATSDYWPHRRVMERAAVAGDRPV